MLNILFLVVGIICVVGLIKSLPAMRSLLFPETPRADPIPTEIAYTDDAVTLEAIASFRRRALNWERIANWSFAFSLATVVIGILIFVFAERIAINSPDLISLRAQRTDLRKNILELKGKSESSEFEARVLSNYATKFSTIRDVVGGLSTVFAMAADPEENVDEFWDNIKEKETDLGEDVIKSVALLASAPQAIEGAKTEDSSIETTILQLCNDSKLDIKQLSALLIITQDMAKSCRECKPEDLKGLAEREKERISIALTSAKELTTPTDTLAGKIEDARKVAVDASLFSLSPVTRKLIREKESEFDQLEQDIRNAEANFNPNNLYSVIPLLVVRLGAVLLLIFLTQILLSAYRYNASLSTHFAAAADALKLTRQELGYSCNADFFKFVEALKPSAVTYIVPEAPSDQLVKLARGGE